MCLQSEQVAKEMVVAVPGTGAIKTDQQLIDLCGIAQPVCAVGPSGDSVHKCTVELLQHGRLQEALAMLVAHTGEELIGHVVDD